MDIDWKKGSLNDSYSTFWWKKRRGATYTFYGDGLTYKKRPQLEIEDNWGSVYIRVKDRNHAERIIKAIEGEE